MSIIKRKKNSILSIIAKFSFVFIFAFLLASPVLAFPCEDFDNTGTPIPYGCNEDEEPQSDGGSTTPQSDGGSTTPSGVKVNTGIVNPLGGVGDLPSFIEMIINFVLIVGVPIVALAIIYSGFLFVTAGGNSEKLTTAKKTLLYTIIGAALLLGSFVIAKAIKGTVDEIKTENKV